MTKPVIMPEAVPLLQKALDHIHQHPEEWDQGDWRSFVDPETGARTDFRDRISADHCGTIGCLAGWLVTLSGEFTDKNYSDLVFKDGSTYSIGMAASLLLTGNTDRIASDWGGLFSDRNSERDLWEKANFLCGGRLNIPLDL